MQHHSSEVEGVADSEFAAIISSAEAAPSCPAASAKATRRSASFRVWDFEHGVHFPTCLVPRSTHIVVYLFQTDLRSCKTFLIPFACPLSSGLG